VQWPSLLEHAAEIVDADPVGMTLRGLFYRLVFEGSLRNTESYYSTLSRATARARRAGWFPSLIDRGRSIRRPVSFDGPDDALSALREQYRRDRTEGQSWAIYLGVEKNALAGVLESWFEDYGLPVLPFGGYGSQTYVDDVVADVAVALRDEPERRSVLIYAGDFDPSGEDILRDFDARTGGYFDEVEHIALTAEQVIDHNLPPQPGKTGDSRAARFVARHGELVQVELDALPLATLRDLYQEAVGRYFDASKYEAALELEERDLEALEGRWLDEPPGDEPEEGDE
jgi:hypothetical protein